MRELERKIAKAWREDDENVGLELEERRGEERRVEGREEVVVKRPERTLAFVRLNSPEPTKRSRPQQLFRPRLLLP